MGSLNYLQRTLAFEFTVGNCGQSYKASTMVIYEPRVVKLSNLLVITTIES